MSSNGIVGFISPFNDIFAQANFHVFRSYLF